MDTVLKNTLDAVVLQLQNALKREYKLIAAVKEHQDSNAGPGYIPFEDLLLYETLESTIVERRLQVTDLKAIVANLIVGL